MLDFIEGHLRVEAGDEAIGIALGSRQNAGIVEGEILAVLSGNFGRLHQGALTCLSGAVDQNSRCVR
jgi:hypothetical protein